MLGGGRCQRSLLTAVVVVSFSGVVALVVMKRKKDKCVGTHQAIYHRKKPANNIQVSFLSKLPPPFFFDAYGCQGPLFGPGLGSLGACQDPRCERLQGFEAGVKGQ